MDGLFALSHLHKAVQIELIIKRNALQLVSVSAQPRPCRTTRPGSRDMIYEGTTRKRAAVILVVAVICLLL